ncbi:sugar phosphate isomerase/epimerase [Paraflavitalea sp. CAU 1676]|uniref:sugar phosphate isomerase/epimerase family protein n=1 Tax=Paraflavitalea sp. CAU 1676 TaxID=3032598 RepID=UPI0023DAD912|nr:sugar phosphate isomerase/epimerase [Paraflavitalea sp. CAU 1676]MDF2193267.1 sugar phosphate isomerase/epimerase [Paraflavitalea sp. CAU 1676]
MTSRRNFLQQSALGLAGSLSLPLVSGAAPAKKGNTPILTGVAGYTFAKFDLEKSIAMMKKVDIKYISIKDIHLPLNSSDEKIESVKKQFADAGINVYAVGVIYMKSKEAVDQAFAYAKKVGVPLVVGVPNPELLDYTESVVKSTGIKIAIHNHGPEDKLYPSPKNVWDLIKDRDEKMGICMDIGHAIRAGADPAEVVKLYKSRLYDLHIKDVSLAAKDGKAIEVGRGVIDFPALVKALQKIRYQGVCSLEFEKDMSDPLAGIAESAGYFKGVVKSLS